MGDRDKRNLHKVYVGNLSPNITEQEISDEFTKFGSVASVWVARNPAGFAFVQYEELRDAEDAVEKLNDKNGWRVELARPQRQREAGDNKCVRQT
ncbi:hypothetical protein H632_c3166p0 [Helicosporidium sp. ATCC 50920]|nr:hypothetical protein H632_c3166p0 [Helicosporidium sp. ATCC 50920]|eukprot:KDD72583.1 hypothetical protein H632_c3166p0 [Helicosporidium sp. ATCC 50920]